MTPLSFARPWTADELATLSRAYARGGYKAALAELPGRTSTSIMHKAERLGVLRRRRWTAANDAELRDLWGDGLSLPRVAKALGRTEATTYWRAQKLGLTGKLPPDHESLSAAAVRTGYGTGQLRAILRWAGFPVKRAFSRPTRSRKHFHIVDSLDVDEALARWHATEPLTPAARRLGVGVDALRKRLAAAGVVSPGHKRHLRVTDTQARAVLAARPIEPRRKRGAA
jgi:hypothetical protein